MKKKKTSSTLFEHWNWMVAVPCRVVGFIVYLFLFEKKQLAQTIKVPVQFSGKVNHIIGIDDVEVS